MGGMSTRHFLTAGPPGAMPQAGRPFLSSHAWRAGSSRDSPCSVPTHTTPPESAARARTRPGAGNSIQLRPPSLERATPRSPAAHRLPSGPAANASTYWSGSRPRTCWAVVAPAESVISPQVAPRSQDSLIPSAVPMYTVSPRVAMPLGATYCHSGPSCEKSQLVHVVPPSVDSPQPFPTVPYQISPPGPNPNACTKSHEMEWALVSLECLICCQLPAPGRSTKMPCPYVPTQRALSGARARASTRTPKPVVSGSGGRDWALDGSGERRKIMLASNAEHGTRNAEQRGEVRRSERPLTAVPRSA